METLETLTLTTWVLALLIAGLGGLVRGISGFGPALVMVPGLSLLIPAIEAVPATVIALALTSLPLILGSRRQAQPATVGWMLGAALLGVPAGTLVFTLLSEPMLRRTAGVVVLVCVGLLATADRIRFGASRPGAVMAGALSGLLNGSVGLGGPPVVLYFIATRFQASASRASVILFFGALQLVTVSIFAVSGVVTGPTALAALVLAPAVAAGGWAGQALFRLGGHRYYRVLALLLLAASGAAALLR